MGCIQEFEKEKLVIGVIYHDKEILNNVTCELCEKFGEIDLISQEYSFSKNFSTYYDNELGGEGIRVLYSFENTVDPTLHAEIKEFTNEIEIKYSDNDGRKINLDPGLMNHGRFMLSTTKNASFRIPLKNGIYTELTLFYARGAWRKFIWTYMDYQSEIVMGFLEKVRKKYLKQRKSEGIVLPKRQGKA